ncbi:MAG TPA: PHB depolymerase family esterase [Bacteroidia bacterium]|jgi:polyhydroxybutyrate depolymerase|nr:PHB depolymerase family esterase [Bacteroidia bacterium]
MKPHFIGLVLVFATSTLSAQQDIDKTIMVDGKQREYVIHLPYDFDKLKKAPILFALHGSGGKSEGTQRLYQLDPLADKYGYIVIYPQAIYKNWNIPGISAYGDVDEDANDVHFISELIDSTAAFYKGDTNNVFVTGLSRGGKFALFLGWKLNNRIRAIAPVCASIPVGMEKDFRFAKPMPTLLINGTADPLVNYNGGYGRMNVGQNVGDGFDMLPTEELVKKLEILNNCDTSTAAIYIPNNNAGDECTAVKYCYKSNSAPVQFIKVIGGGHTWPGSLQYLPKFLIGSVCLDFNAADEIFNFFTSVSKQ